MRTVERWYLQFWQGSFVLEDQPHTGRPSDVATLESVDAVRKAIILNKRITYRQLEELRFWFVPLRQTEDEKSAFFVR